MSKKYKVISYHFKDFDYGDILELCSNKEQYARPGDRLGSAAFMKIDVETSPKFFELVEFDYTEEELLFKLSKFDNFYRNEDSKYLLKEAIDELRKYLLDFKESMD